MVFEPGKFGCTTTRRGLYAILGVPGWRIYETSVCWYCGGAKAAYQGHAANDAQNAPRLMPVLAFDVWDADPVLNRATDANPLALPPAPNKLNWSASHQHGSGSERCTDGAERHESGRADRQCGSGSQRQCGAGCLERDGCGDRRLHDPVGPDPSTNLPSDPADANVALVYAFESVSSHIA